MNLIYYKKNIKDKIFKGKSIFSFIGKDKGEGGTGVKKFFLFSLSFIICQKKSSN